MTDDLYRQEALDHRNKSLYGEVVLSSPPRTWFITLLLVAVMLLLGGILLFGDIQTDSGPVSVLRWLLSKGG